MRLLIQASLTHRRSTSVEVEPTASSSEAETVQTLQRQTPPTDTETVSTPLLHSSPARTSRFTVPPPSGPHRRQSPRVLRIGTPRRRDAEQQTGAVVLASRNDSSNSEKAADKPRDPNSPSGNDDADEPLASTSDAGTASQYVEFEGRATARAEAATATVEVDVETAAPHEYCYTTEPSAAMPGAAVDVEAVTQESPSLPPRERPAAAMAAEGPAEAAVAHPRCLYCDELFDPASNRPGACPDAPDCAGDCVEHASCLCCARAVVYHCLEPADDAGSPSPGDGDPCACDGGLSGARRCRRWTSLGLLAVVVPCLCLYWPLASCHRCAVHVGCCGGRHSASSSHVLVV